MGEMPYEEPSEDAYGRVTNPERFGVLHDAARHLIDDLMAAYRPERLDGAGLDPEHGGFWPDAPAAKLTPCSGAPLTFTFTPFPGVALRYGIWGEVLFPWCGCDACNEGPEQAAEEMAEWVDAVVHGGLTETRRRRPFQSDWYLSEVVCGGFSSRRSRQMTFPPIADRLPFGTTRWGPWRAS